jgi:hypothetical protein
LGKRDIEQDEGFRALRERYPLQARLVLGFFGYAEKALESLTACSDVPAAQNAVFAMAELWSWLKNASPPLVDKERSETFAMLVRAGVPIEDAGKTLQRATKGRGRPVTNRLPVLQAVEQRMLNPKLSWMRLAVMFCQCGKRHGPRCRERIRHQAMDLEEMLTRLGV